ncbi:MAG: hypothetical protein AB7I19_17040 [Planctomycetota bacterium]
MSSTRRRPIDRSTSKVFPTVVALGAMAAGAMAWWSHPAPKQVPADATIIEAQLDGLDCRFWCSVGIATAIADLPAVVLQRFDPTTSTAHFAFDPKQTSEALLRARLAAKWNLRRWERRHPQQRAEEPAAISR